MQWQELVIARNEQGQYCPKLCSFSTSRGSGRYPPFGNQRFSSKGSLSRSHRLLLESVEARLFGGTYGAWRLLVESRSLEAP